MGREVYRNKTQQFRSRWLNIEARQLQVKQNLVKFNNFVKEKQGKVADGISRTILEKKKQTDKNKECRKVEEDWEVHREAKDILNYHKNLQERPNKRTAGGLSESYINHHIYALKLFFQ